MSHDDACELVGPDARRLELRAFTVRCLCPERADSHRFQAENWDRVSVATESEKDEVLRWLNDHDPDALREAMDETGVC